MMSITCPHCSRVGTLKATVPPGTKVRCPGCQNRFEVQPGPEDDQVIELEDVVDQPAIRSPGGQGVIRPVAHQAEASPATQISQVTPLPTRSRWPLILGALAMLMIMITAGVGWAWHRGAFEPNYIALGFQSNAHKDWTTGEHYYRLGLAGKRDDGQVAILQAGLGRSLVGLERYHEAVDAFHEAIWATLRAHGSSKDQQSLDLQLSTLYQELGTAEILNKQIDTGLKDYAKGVERYDDFRGQTADGAGLLDLADLYRTFERFDDASEAIDRALTRYQNNQYLIGMARCYEAQAELARAREPQNPGAGDVYDRMGLNAREAHRDKTGYWVPREADPDRKR